MKNSLALTLMLLHAAVLISIDNVNATSEGLVVGTNSTDKAAPVVPQEVHPGNEHWVAGNRNSRRIRFPRQAVWCFPEAFDFSYPVDIDGRCGVHLPTGGPTIPTPSPPGYSIIPIRIIPTPTTPSPIPIPYPYPQPPYQQPPYQQPPYQQPPYPPYPYPQYYHPQPHYELPTFPPPPPPTTTPPTPPPTPARPTLVPGGHCYYW